MGDDMGAGRAELKYSEAACEVALGASPVAAALLGAAALASLALIGLTPGPSALRILAATWVCCAALEALHRVALHRGAGGVRGLALRGGGEIAVENVQGLRRSGRLRDGSFVAPWLTIVRWRPDGARFDRAVAILPDMLAAEPFRRLRVALRWS
jgi:toxin CptA